MVFRILYLFSEKIIARSVPEISPGVVFCDEEDEDDEQELGILVVGLEEFV